MNPPNENAALVLAPPSRTAAELLEQAGVEAAQMKRVAGSLVGRAVVMLAERYGLDPLLKHVEVIPVGGALTVYVTVDGWEFVAARSGEWDGLTYPDVSYGPGESGKVGWRATCWVRRKGCAYPFEGRAKCLDSETKPDHEAMAMARARRRALKTAFRDCLRVDAEYLPALKDNLDTDGGATVEPAPTEPRNPDHPGEGSDRGGLAELPITTRAVPRPEGQSAAHAAIGKLPQDEQKTFLAAHGIDTFGSVWPDQAVAEALELPF